MPVRKIDLLKSSKEISVNETKEIWRLTIKFIRKYAKDVGLNQFITAIELLTQTKECVKVCLNYIDSINREKEFYDYIKSLSETLLLNFKNLEALITEVDNKAIPLFFEVR